MTIYETSDDKKNYPSPCSRGREKEQWKGIGSFKSAERWQMRAQKSGRVEIVWRFEKDAGSTKRLH